MLHGASPQAAGKASPPARQQWAPRVLLTEPKRLPPRARCNLDGGAAARAAIAEAERGGARIAAFFSESILSCGGQVVLPEGYLAGVYREMRAHGAVCVADEVQCGFGRVGRAFWAFQLQEVVPDIVTFGEARGRREGKEGGGLPRQPLSSRGWGMRHWTARLRLGWPSSAAVCSSPPHLPPLPLPGAGKPCGNGFPMAGLVTSPRLAKAFSNGMEFFATFGETSERRCKQSGLQEGC